MVKRSTIGIFLSISALLFFPILSAHAETNTPGKTTVPTPLKSPLVEKPIVSPRMEETLRDQSQKGIKDPPGGKPLPVAPKDPGNEIVFPPLTGTTPLPPQSGTPGKTTAPTQLKGPYVDEPKVSPRMEKDLRDQSQKGIKKLPGKKPVSVGPSINSFSAIANDCVNPDPNRPILSYRVSAPPGAARIQRVKINALHGDSDRIRVIHDQSAPPGNPWPEVSGSGIRDPEPTADILAYVLVVYSTEGRSLSRRLTYRYRRPLRFEFLSRNAAWDRSTNYLGARARLENAGNASWEYTDAGGTHRYTGVRVMQVDYERNTYNLSWGPFANVLNRSQTFTITFEPISRACGEIPIARTILWASPYGTVHPPGRTGGTPSGCDDPREGRPCSVHPGECFGRGADWTVSGRYQCVSGEVQCVAERGRDYCTACGGICGGCIGNSCSESSLCAPGSTCIDNPALTQRPSCRSLNDDYVARMTGRRVCTYILGFCWTPSEVGRAEIICRETR